jgi:hypothetical protein
MASLLLLLNYSRKVDLTVTEALLEIAEKVISIDC